MKQGVSAIIYDSNGYYLILHRKSNWEGWEFVKGGMNEGEDSESAVRREIQEETGLRQFNIIGKLSEQRRFTSPEGDEHVFDMYLVESNMNIPVVIDKNEHDTFLWATPERVMEKLHWPEEKALFDKTVKAIAKRNQ